ncbi:MAG: hypothetical protein DRP11_04480 [Candidatus Aenigmatarchaeota archaeon]|nr:MAG: hypothetical protein DRP11_04480 [Candidatus Aenigmarchaeota archaeon]
MVELLAFPGRKGISPLIAAVLLIAFTITVAAVLATWASSFVKTQTQTIEQSAEQTECTKANLRVEEAEWDQANSQLNVLVLNIGDVELSKFKIYIFTSATQFTEETPSNSDDVLAKGDYGSFSVPMSSEPVKIQVISDTCPVEAKYTCTYVSGRFIC